MLENPAEIVDSNSLDVKCFSADSPRITREEICQPVLCN